MSMGSRKGVASLAAGAAAISALVAGCAVPGAAGGSVPGTGAATGAPTVPSGKAQPAWTPAPARPHEILYRDGSLRSMPAPTGAKTKVTSTAAIGTAVAASSGLITDPSRAKASLRLVSDDLPPGKSNGEAPLKDTLAWIVSVPGNVPRSGPPGKSATSTTYDCTIWAVIPADSAVAVRNFYRCDPRSS